MQTAGTERWKADMKKKSNPTAPNLGTPTGTEAVAGVIEQPIVAPAPKKGDKILVQTDSVEAIHALRCGAHVRPIATAAVKHVKALQEAHGFTYILRHVKGHKGAATPRNAVNTWCDRECRRLMGTLLAGNADQLALPGIGE